MKKLYEKIVASLIFSTKSSTYSKNIWPFTVILNLSAAISFNIASIWMIINKYFFPHFCDFMSLEIFSNKTYNELSNFIVYLFLPICLFNYMYIFYKKRYVLLEEKYQNNNHMKIGRIYFGLSWFGYFAIFFWIYIIFK